MSLFIFIYTRQNKPHIKPMKSTATTNTKKSTKRKNSGRNPRITIPRKAHHDDGLHCYYTFFWVTFVLQYRILIYCYLQTTLYRCQVMINRLILMVAGALAAILPSFRVLSRENTKSKAYGYLKTATVITGTCVVQLYCLRAVLWYQK